MTEQTDRELLESAAKAAGIRLEWDGPPDKWQPMYYEGKTYHAFDPLTDDGDALRLACKLRINIEHAETLSRKAHGVNCWPVGRGDCGSMENDLTDYNSATRRAITRAAAAIGETMP